MEQEIISAFLDDELNLEEKESFVRRVHGDDDVYHETLSLLAQERRLRAPVSDKVPEAPVARSRHVSWRPLALAAAVVLVASAVFWVRPEPLSPPREYRFVVYLPGVESAELVGSFSGWRPVAMQPAGQSGYWEAVVPLESGEYRYAFVAGGERMADPTSGLRETDDFGGENSILVWGGEA